MDWLPHTSRASRRRTEGARARVIAVRNNGKDDPSLRSVGTRKHCHSLLRIRFLYCLLPSQNLPQIAISVGRGKVHKSPQKSSWEKVEASIVQYLINIKVLTMWKSRQYGNFDLYLLDTLSLGYSWKRMTTYWYSICNQIPEDKSRNSYIHERIWKYKTNCR